MLAKGVYLLFRYQKEGDCWSELLEVFLLECSSQTCSHDAISTWFVFAPNDQISMPELFNHNLVHLHGCFSATMIQQSNHGARTLMRVKKYINIRCEKSYNPYLHPHKNHYKKFVFWDLKFFPNGCAMDKTKPEKSPFSWLEVFSAP